MIIVPFVPFCGSPLFVAVPAVRLLDGSLTQFLSSPSIGDIYALP